MDTHRAYTALDKSMQSLLNSSSWNDVSSIWYPALLIYSHPVNTGQ